MGIGYKQYMSSASSSSLCVQKVYRLLQLKLKPLFFSGRDWFSWAAGDTDGIWALRYQFFKVTSVVSIECTRIWESDCQFIDDRKNRKILSRCMRTWCLIIRLWVQKHCQVYADLMSQPARSVVIFCRAAGVPHEHVGVGTQFFFLPCLDLKLVLQRWGSLQGTPRLRSTRRWTPCARWNTSFIPHMWGMQGGLGIRIQASGTHPHK